MVDKRIGREQVGDERPPCYRSLWQSLFILGFSGCQTLWDGEPEALRRALAAGFMLAFAAFMIWGIYEALRGRRGRPAAGAPRSEREADAIAIGLLGASLALFAADIWGGGMRWALFLAASGVGLASVSLINCGFRFAALSALIPILAGAAHYLMAA